MPVQNLDARSIFLAAVEVHAPSEWPAFLEVACGDDEALRKRVELLLAAHGKYNELLDGSGLIATLDRPPRERLGTRIGPYKLLEQIGEGGCGIVYLAEQVQPVRRRVALKVIKPGMDTEQVIARFEAERQALAVMDHPNIARVFDAGATQSGRPFFVMEWVRGVPITQYCDENSLTIRDRLTLFATVCQAIQHAHTKGIIHRDIKPTNVLVTGHDGHAVVKVIDFGIAKAMGSAAGGLTDKTRLTEFAQVIGTPLYMSPEQAELSSTDIDTRSDIYSLGVLLYELLTGSTPVRKEQLKQAAFDEIRRIIREEDPQKPSTRLESRRHAPCAAVPPDGTRSLPATLVSIAAQRHTEPARLTRLIRGELDWIVMKALDKDRDRRYSTAIGLAQDIERHLRDEPVLACAPSTWYRLRKLVRRNRVIFAGAAAAVMVALLGVTALVTSNVLIRQEQARTRQEKVRAQRAQKLAEGRAEEVRQGLERLKAANALLDRGRWYAQERNWDDAHAAFSQAIQLHPDHVSVWVERGDLHTRLGLWDLAAADYAREIELRQPATTLRWYQHALLRRAIGDEEGCRQTSRAMRERFAGTTKERFAEETLRSSLLVPDPAADLSPLVELAREVVPNNLWCLPYVLGTAHYRNGQHDEAIQRLHDWAAQPQWPMGRISYPVQAMAHHRLGHPNEARQALDQAARFLDQWTQVRYEQSNLYAGTDAWPMAWWDYLECQLYYREAKLLIDGAAPPDDPRLHVLRARALAGLDWAEKAAPEFDAALQLAPQDPQIRLEAHCNRGRCCVHRRQWREAAAEFAKAAELRPSDATLWRFSAVAHFAAGDHDAYRQTCTAMVERFARTEDRGTAAGVLAAAALRDDALPDMAVLLPLASVSDPLGHWGAVLRGAALYRTGRYAECVQCFESAAVKYRPRPWDLCFLAMAQHRLGRADEARRRLAEATHWIDAAKQHTDDDPSGMQPVWGGWTETAVCPLLLAEAEQLLNRELAACDQQSVNAETKSSPGRALNAEL